MFGCVRDYDLTLSAPIEKPQHKGRFPTHKRTPRRRKKQERNGVLQFQGRIQVFVVLNSFFSSFFFFFFFLESGLGWQRWRDVEFMKQEVEMRT